MPASLPYTEETFGILTDDDLYLDCVFVRPANASDERLRAVRAWIPRYPLTKTSVLTCARQEVQSYGPDGKIAHLVFDLRGTGDSDGMTGDNNFKLDLAAVKAWAKERFGEEINFGFFGLPDSRYSRVYMWPLRPGIVMESYYYHPSGSGLRPPTLLYLSSYGNFSRQDDALCAALAHAGYNVYGLDPFRYLLHASVNGGLTPDVLWEDIHLLAQMLPSEPIFIGQPLASGLAILWAARTPAVRGVIAIGRAQAGFLPAHVFQNRNPHTFQLAQFVANLAPRPLALVQQESHAMGGDLSDMEAEVSAYSGPVRLEKADQMSPELLLELLAWIQEKQPASGSASRAASTGEASP